MTQLTWLITGCTSGLSERFVLSILARGDRAIATSRGNSTERLAGLIEAGAAVLDLDVTASHAEIDSIIDEAIKIYGVIDVLVNTAGYIEAGMVDKIR
jgi:NAD(P)-dependent dehydrogenase (short-subunit alcohol dehydrogenase family)